MVMEEVSMKQLKHSPADDDVAGGDRKGDNGAASGVVKMPKEVGSCIFSYVPPEGTGASQCVVEEATVLLLTTAEAIGMSGWQAAEAR
jgi:hypothetical protein